MKTFSFYDHKQRKAEEKQKFAALFDVDCEHQYAGFEALIATEMPADRLWAFLADLRDSGENGQVGIPAARPSDDDIRNIARNALASGKGVGWAARLFEECDLAELPATVITFLSEVYGHFPKPAEPAPAPTGDDAAQAASAGAAPA